MTHTIQGKRVKRLRLDLNMGQNELVAALVTEGVNIGQSHLSLIERGDRNAGVEVLAALATVLQTSSDYLLGLTDDPTPYSDMENQVILVEKDEERRAMLQRLFSTLERLPPEIRAGYYAMLHTLYTGIAAQRNEQERRSGN